MVSPAEQQGFNAEGLDSVHLRIAECIFTRRPTLISTVLGSCVTATFFHPETRASAMFHSMLPHNSMEVNSTKSCKFVNTAIEGIMARYVKLGIEPEQITVKLFGGAFTIQPERKKEVLNVVDVGIKNVKIARERLKDYGLKIVSENVLGERSRKLLFNTGTGEVWMKFLSPDSSENRRKSFSA